MPTEPKHILALVLVLALALPTVASAFCTAPLAPTPPVTWNKPTKPSVPYCINEYARTHTCSDWEIESYRSDMNRFRNEVSDYIAELQRYISAVNLYADQAVSYAVCEADDVQNQ